MCRPLDPLPSPFIASPVERPREWIIIAGATALLILMLALTRRRQMQTTMQVHRKYFVLALTAIGFACLSAAFDIVIVGELPWSDAMYASASTQITRVGAVADYSACYDALNQHFSIAWQSGEFTYAMIIVVASIVGVVTLTLARVLLRQHARSTATGTQPARQG